MNIATTAQWLLLGAYLSLLLWTPAVGWLLPRLRPVAFAAGSIALTHTVYYASFLLWPDWLDYTRTMLFSLAIRFQVFFTITLGMALAVRRGRWR